MRTAGIAITMADKTIKEKKMAERNDCINSVFIKKEIYYNELFVSAKTASKAAPKTKDKTG